MKVAAAADAIVGRLNTNKKLATFSVSGGATVAVFTRREDNLLVPLNARKFGRAGSRPRTAFAAPGGSQKRAAAKGLRAI